MQPSQPIGQRYPRSSHKACSVSPACALKKRLACQPSETWTIGAPAASTTLGIWGTWCDTEERCAQGKGQVECQTWGSRPPSWWMTREELQRRPTTPSGMRMHFQTYLCIRTRCLAMIKIQPSQVQGICYTVGLLNIEPLGSTICWGYTKDCSEILSCFSHRNLTKWLNIQQGF